MTSVDEAQEFFDSEPQLKALLATVLHPDPNDLQASVDAYATLMDLMDIDTEP
jgi:hypothetical protein